MARPPLTLAALATAAVPGLEVTATARHTRRSHGAYDAVRLRAADGRELLIRVPRTQTAESEQSADLVALRALTDGVRSRLPFAIPVFVGQAPIEGTRAIVTEFIHGSVRSADELTEYDRVADSVGLAIAAVHNLPTAFIVGSGLPRQDVAEARDAAVELIGRAADTGRLPAALERRWQEATDDDALWRFQPTIVNGALGAESFLIDADRVTGIVGWGHLAQGDPARDLHWLFTSRGAAAEHALEAYLLAREGAADAHLPQRALLYGELELARWLLHGIDVHDEAVVADAEALLDGLVESVHDRSSEPLAPETGPIMTVGDVERMLDGTPKVAEPRDGAAMLLTDSYDFSEFERHAAGERQPAPMDATAPIPLDLSDWGDAAAPTAATADRADQDGKDTAAADADESAAEAEAADASADDQARRSSPSS